MIRRQIEIGQMYNQAGMPFMRLRSGPITHGDVFVVAHEWLAGRAVQSPTVEQVRVIGDVLRRMHDIGRHLDKEPPLPVHDLVSDARRGLAAIEPSMPVGFVERAREMLDLVPGGAPGWAVIHGDLANDNVLWTVSGELVGVIDFDKIGVGDPVEELAKAVKWWSRPGGVGDSTYSTKLAAALLDGYGADVRLRARLRPYLWFSGCLHHNGITAMRAAAGDPNELERVVAHYRRRAESLAALAETGQGAWRG